MRRLLSGFIASLLFIGQANAGRGFGTYGTATTSRVQTTSSSVTIPTQSTFSIWVFSDSTVGSRIFDNGANNNMSFSSIGEGFSTTNGAWTFTAPTTLAWHNIVVVYDGTATTNAPIIYIDGTSVTVTQTTAPAGTFTPGTNVLTIGNRSGADRTFNGCISDFAIYAGLLTASQALSLSQGASPLKVDPAALYFYTPMLGVAASDPEWSITHRAMSATSTKACPSNPKVSYPLSGLAQ